MGLRQQIRRVVLLSALLLPLLGQSAVIGQQAGQNQSAVLTINQERLFSGSLYAERIRRELEVDKARLEKDVRQIEADLIAEEKSLTEQRASMPADEFRKLADAFDEKVQGIRKAQKAKASNLNQKLERERAAFYKLVLPVIGQLMQERGALVVLDQRTVFVSANAVDITDAALERIDATIGDGAGQDGSGQNDTGNE